MMKDRPIFVTGMPRSGLSLVAGFLSACGAWTPPETPRRRAHRYLNHEILIRVSRPIFRGLKASASGFGTIPETVRFEAIAGEVAPTIRREVLRILGEQGYEGGPWIYRSADACVAWPLWDMAFPEALWVLVRRPVPAIVFSCRSTGYARGPKDDVWWERWARAYIVKFGEMGVGGPSIFDVRPHLWFTGSLIEPTRLLDAVGLTADDDRIRDALSPALWASGVFRFKEVIR